MVLSIALYDWVARQMESAYKAAFAVGAAQFALVNIDVVLHADELGYSTTSTPLQNATRPAIFLAASFGSL